MVGGELEVSPAPVPARSLSESVPRCMSLRATVAPLKVEHRCKLFKDSLSYLSQCHAHQQD